MYSTSKSVPSHASASRCRHASHATSPVQSFHPANRDDIFPLNSKLLLSKANNGRYVPHPMNTLIFAHQRLIQGQIRGKSDHAERCFFAGGRPSSSSLSSSSEFSAGPLRSSSSDSKSASERASCSCACAGKERLATILRSSKKNALTH